MRITNNMLVKDMLWNANKNLQSMATKQTELSTGKKIHRPSDDPVGITQVLKFKTDIRETEQYGENIRDALGWLEVSESALTDIKDILQRIRELTVQAANGSNNADDTSKIKTEVSELTKEIVVLGNSTIAGRYIFSGLQTDTKLFNDDGTYNIDMTSERSANQKSLGYEISVGEVMDLSVSPVDIFGVVQTDSYFEGMITPQTVTTTPATATNFTATVDLTHNYATGDVLAFAINGANYHVDESSLVPPTTQFEFITALENAVGVNGKLSDVADIRIDPGNLLVITAKEFGPTVTMFDNSTSAGLSGNLITYGTDPVNATTIVGNFPLSDAKVKEYINTTTLKVTYDGLATDLNVDLNAADNVEELVSQIQSKLDSAYGPDRFLVSGEDGQPLEITTLGVYDDIAHTFDIGIVTQQGSFFSSRIDRQTVETDKATATKFSTSVNLNYDYSGDTLDIDVGGTTYNVDESLLDNTIFNPVTKEKIIDAYKNADDGVGGVLSDVADVYFDVNDKLVIVSKTYGSTGAITDITASAGLTGNAITLGLDGVDKTMSSNVALLDTDVQAFTDTNTLMLKLDGVQERFDVDFSGLNTVSDLVTELQTQIDSKFGAGKIVVAGGDGLTLDFTAVATDDGESHTLNMDIVFSQESELIHDLRTLEDALTVKDDDALQLILGKLDKHLDRVLTAAGEIGGKTNRIEFISNRIDENKLTYTSLLSKVQDVDMAEAIMLFKNLENVYRASLSVGSKVIQPSLVDFIQ